MKVRCSYSNMMSIDNIKRHPENDKIHPNNEDLNKRLAKIMEYQGWRFPIVVSRQTGYIIAGHARLEAAKILGMKEVPVDLQDFDNYDQEVSQLVSDNALQEWRSINLAAVNQVVVPSLDGINFDIDLLGIDGFTAMPEDKFKIDEKEVDENLNTEKECPNCGYRF